MTFDRGDWPRWYGVCRLSEGERSDLARWAYYNIGAQMTAREHREPRTVVREAPYFDFICSRCGQARVPGRTLRDQPASEPLVCAMCRALDHEPQGESVRLFEPAPTQLPGQLGFQRAGSYECRHCGALEAMPGHCC